MADGEIVANSDWESKDWHYRVRLENKWFDVPENQGSLNRTVPVARWSGPYDQVV
jgi:hypothetical protein